MRPAQLAQPLVVHLTGVLSQHQRPRWHAAVDACRSAPPMEEDRPFSKMKPFLFPFPPLTMTKTSTSAAATCQLNLNQICVQLNYIMSFNQNLPDSLVAKFTFRSMLIKSGAHKGTQICLSEGKNILYHRSASSHSPTNFIRSFQFQ